MGGILSYNENMPLFKELMSDHLENYAMRTDDMEELGYCVLSDRDILHGRYNIHNFYHFLVRYSDERIVDTKNWYENCRPTEEWENVICAWCQHHYRLDNSNFSGIFIDTIVEMTEEEWKSDYSTDIFLKRISETGTRGLDWLAYEHPLPTINDEGKYDICRFGLLMCYYALYRAKDLTGKRRLVNAMLTKNFIDRDVCVHAVSKYLEVKVWVYSSHEHRHKTQFLTPECVTNIYEKLKELFEDDCELYESVMRSGFVPVPLKQLVLDNAAVFSTDRFALTFADYFLRTYHRTLCNASDGVRKNKTAEFVFDAWSHGGTGHALLRIFGKNKIVFSIRKRSCPHMKSNNVKGRCHCKTLLSCAKRIYGILCNRIRIKFTYRGDVDGNLELPLDRLKNCKLTREGVTGKSIVESFEMCDTSSYVIAVNNNNNKRRKTGHRTIPTFEKCTKLTGGLQKLCADKVRKMGWTPAELETVIPDSIVEAIYH